VAEKLTDALIRDLIPPLKGNKITYDTEVIGLGVRVTSAGARAFILNYRAGRTERRITIGSAGDWTVSKARARAREMRRLIDVGADPMADRHAERQAPTVNDLCDKFEAEHLPRRRPATQNDYRSIIRLHIRPQLGGKAVAAVEHGDTVTLHNRIMTTAPYRANRTIAVLSKMFALAVTTWKMRPDNPVIGVERAPEQKRERYLSPAEIARLGDALALHPEKGSANAIRLLLLTGARRGEVLSATWSQFDLDAGVWTKPAATTKQAKLHRVPLSKPALIILTEMKAAADKENTSRLRDKVGPPEVYLFPGVRGGHVTEIKKSWTSLCSKAGINGARLHDLRHTYASILASSGLSLPIIGQLLGHTQAATTARYAHLSDDPLRAATERIGAIVTGAGESSVELVHTARQKQGF
jgi:integrase